MRWNQVVVLRFFIDPSTGMPHILGDNVTEKEVEDVLAWPVEDRPGAKGPVAVCLATPRWLRQTRLTG